MGGTGTQTAALAFGGNVPAGVTGETEQYDGTSWSAVPASLGTARARGGAAGTTSSALYAFGEGGSNTTATEEFTPEVTASVLITTS